MGAVNILIRPSRTALNGENVCKALQVFYLEESKNAATSTHLQRGKQCNSLVPEIWSGLSVFQGLAIQESPRISRIKKKKKEKRYFTQRKSCREPSNRWCQILVFFTLASSVSDIPFSCTIRWPWKPLQCTPLLLVSRHRALCGTTLSLFCRVTACLSAALFPGTDHPFMPVRRSVRWVKPNVSRLTLLLETFLPSLTLR